MQRGRKLSKFTEYFQNLPILETFQNWEILEIFWKFTENLQIFRPNIFIFIFKNIFILKLNEFLFLSL